MKLFVDTANLEEIKESLSWGFVDGVTTNPSLVAKEGRPFRELAAEICRLVPGPVHFGVVARAAEEMMVQARELARLSERVIVKLPVSQEALRATKALAAEGISVNVTLCFSPAQALLAAKAGAACVTPYLGRLDDASQNGIEVVAQMMEIFDNYGFSTEILVASVRHTAHVVDAARLGVDAAAVPYPILAQLAEHPLTEAGIRRFETDWGKVRVK